MTVAGSVPFVLAVALALQAPVEASAPEAEASAPEADVRDVSASWDDPAPAEAPATQSSPAAPDAAPLATPSAPPPRLQTAPPPEPVDDSPRGEGRVLVATGAALVAVGAAALVLVSLPAALVRRSAMNRAERTPLPELETKERRLRRAHNANGVMQGAFWTGVVAVGVGIPLLVGGALLRKRARDDLTSRLELDATGITVRF